MELLSTPARLLVEAVALVRAQVPTDLPPAQALAETAVLLRELDRLRAVALARVADVETRQLHALDAAPSTGTWLQQRGGTLDRSDVALARRLPRMPALADAVADGALPLAAAEQVARAVDLLRRHVDRPDGRIGGADGERVLANVVVEGVLFQLAEARGGWDDDDPELDAVVDALVGILRSPQGQLARLEQAFVLLARRIDRPLLAQALERLVDAVLPQRLEDAAERGHRERGLRLRLKSDGSGWTLARSDLDLECGAYLEAVLAAARATDPDNPADTSAWALLRAEEARGPGSRPGAGSGGAGPSGAAAATTADSAGAFAGSAGAAAAEPHDGGAPRPRSRVQRDHDALRLALRRLLDSGALGLRAKVAPHLTVTVPAAAVCEEPGALPAVTASGVALPAGLVRRLLCDCALTRAVLSLGRRVTEFSHTQRTLTAPERLAMLVQWGHRCAGAGCTSPPGSALVPHHATPWHRTGRTSLADSVPLCETTHHDLHEGGRTVRLRDGRLLGPDGWVDVPDG